MLTTLIRWRPARDMLAMRNEMNRLVNGFFGGGKGNNGGRWQGFCLPAVDLHEAAQYHRVERAYGALQRAFRLPTLDDADKAEANFKAGVLELKLPTAEQAKPKRVGSTG